MPQKPIAQLQREMEAAQHELDTMEPGNTTRDKYNRFRLQTIIRKCKAQIQAQRRYNRAKNVRKYYKKKVNTDTLKRLFTDLTFQDLGYGSAAEVRNSSLTEAVNRCKKIYKKEHLTFAQISDIIRLLDERSNNILGKDK